MWRWPVGGERLGDLEPFDVRQPHVEQHQVGPQRPSGGEPRPSVACLADDVEAVVLQQGARVESKVGVIVHDQDRVHGLQPDRFVDAFVQG